MNMNTHLWSQEPGSIHTHTLITPQLQEKESSSFPEVCCVIAHQVLFIYLMFGGIFNPKIAL